MDKRTYKMTDFELWKTIAKWDKIFRRANWELTNIIYPMSDYLWICVGKEEKHKVIPQKYWNAHSVYSKMDIIVDQDFS